MGTKEIKDIIKEELPRIIQTDEEVLRLILRLSSQYYAGKIETEDRFDRILKELQRDREEQNSRWEDQNRKWEDQNRKWEENQKIIQGLFEGLKAVNRKYDQGIGALGARWGLHSEASFRNALAGILEGFFKVQVLHINEFDDQGEVFGRPDQVELDLIIKNGILIICEIKSSISRAEMHIFDRKVQFYEKHHKAKTSSKIVISPMVEEKAKELAKDLGITIYSYAEDVKDIF